MLLEECKGVFEENEPREDISDVGWTPERGVEHQVGW